MATFNEYDGDIYLTAREAVRAYERDQVTGRGAEGPAARREIADDYPFLVSLGNCVELPPARLDAFRVHPSTRTHRGAALDVKRQ